MPNFDKQKVNVAVDHRSKLDLSSTHITTANFMQLQPVYYRHMMPREHIKGSGMVLSRLAPVAVPTYGRCRINLRTFFVPFRTIFPNWNEFITDTIGSNVANNSLISKSPYILNSDFTTFFLGGLDPDGQPLVTQVTDAGEIAAGAYDFKSSSSYYYRFSYYGRLYHKIVQSLGYRVIWDIKTGNDLEFSALALMSYAKVYMDWYANQAYLDSVEYLTLQRMFKYNDPTSAFHFDQSYLNNLMHFVGMVCYDTGNDVFVNAWDNPVAPNAGLYSSSLGGYDVTGMVQSGGSPTLNSGFSVVLDSNGTPFMQQSSNTNASIGTEYLHEFLKSMTDYIKRNQLSGAAQIDRFLARYGVNLDSAKASRSIYVSSQSIDVDFGSVMSTADTSSGNVGDYAGQGMGKGQVEFDFVADEFGLFIVTSSIVPASRLYQGIDRNNFHIDKTSFFTPEFDNLGCSAISKGEIYVSTDGNFAAAPNYSGIFAFAPRYYEYKQKSDFVTGDFVSPATMMGGDSWHLNRELSDDTFSGNIANVVHSLDFTRGIDSGQYNRIFHNTSDEVDKFYLVYHFGVMSLAPCQSLFDTYDFDSAGNALQMNGNSAKVN